MVYIRFFIPLIVSLVAVLAFFPYRLGNLSSLIELGRSPFSDISSAVKSFTGIDYEGRVSP